MNIKKIENEEAKWENESFLEEVRGELCNYVNDLDKILSERYRKIIQELNPNIREQALETLQIKKIFDDKMQYIGNTDIVEFNKKEKIANGGYINGRIIINPNSAKQFYAAYIDFANGKTDVIRDFDYEKPLSELKELSSLEILYWYYFNEKTYQDFLKSTMLHEDIHRWTLEATMVDSQIDKFAMEGFVEKEARNVAEENNLEYANCFRNDEMSLIDYLSNGIFDKYDNAVSMLYNVDPQQCLGFAMKMKVFKGLDEKSVKRAEELARNMYLELMNKPEGNNTNSFGKNYREIFAGMKTNKSDEIIKYIEDKIAKEKEIGENFTLKYGVEATIEKTRIEQMNQQTNQIKEQYQDKEEQQTQVEQ